VIDRASLRLRALVASLCVLAVAPPVVARAHQGDVGHTLVVGPTGAGKSVLLNLLDLQFRRYDRALVFRFDKGRSSKTASMREGASKARAASDQCSKT